MANDMMGYLRKHQVAIVWVVALVIIPVFGIGGLLTSLAERRNDPVIGTVDGRRVRTSDLQVFMSRHQLGRRDLSWTEIMGLYIAVKKAEHVGLKVSDLEIAQLIAGSAAFKGANGAFDPVLFREHLEQTNMTEQAFVNGLREQLLLDKCGPGRNSLLIQPVPVTAAEVKFAFHQSKDRYKIKCARVPLPDLTPEQEPDYAAVRAVYAEAEARLDRGEDPTEGEFFKQFPIEDELRKQWVIVDYLAVLWSEIEPLLDVTEDAVAGYYQEHRDLYRVEETPPAEGTPPPPAAAPRYKPLEEVRAAIRDTMLEREARRIAEVVRDRVKDIKTAADSKDLNVSLADLAKGDYLSGAVLTAGFTAKPGAIVIHGISDPVDVPTGMYMPVIIDRRVGAMFPSFYGGGGRTDFDRALEVLHAPDTEIPTEFLETQNGYCMFVPVWWPNKDLPSDRRGRTDLTFKVPLPAREMVETAADGATPLATTGEIGSLLDVKIENARVNAGVKMYQHIRKLLRQERMEEQARKRADKLHDDIKADSFDQDAAAADVPVTIEPLKNLDDGGAAVTACFHLKTGAEVSEVFKDRDNDGKTYMGIGLLLETEIADESALTEEEARRIREGLERNRQADYLTLIEIINDLGVSVAK